MKVALLTDGIHPYVIGGMQKHSFYLAKYFASNKVEVDLYHTLENTDDAKELSCFSKEENKFINSIIIPFPLLDKFPGHYIREMAAYSDLICSSFLSRPPVDFIYIQGLCGIKLLQQKNKINIPTGINFHGLEMFQKAANAKSKMEQYLFRKPVLKSLNSADFVFSLGGKLNELLLKIGLNKEKIVQIPIGIDKGWLRTSPLSANPKRVFVFIGRYERRKGIEELTQALKSILNYDFEFHFIGAIPLNKRIKSGKIQYWGSLNDSEKIKSILMKSDVLVCPSYSEGMPTVILEAMASGLAIIATNVGAVSEQVNSENGILIKPGNKMELKNAIISFIQMPESNLKNLKEASLLKCKSKFMWDDIILKTISFIKTSKTH